MTSRDELPPPDTRTDEHIDGMGDPAYSVKAVEAARAPLLARIAELGARERILESVSGKPDHPDDERSFAMPFVYATQRAEKAEAEVELWKEKAASASEDADHNYEKCRELSAEVERLRSDAARYRYLRTRPQIMMELGRKMHTVELDRSIDAALTEQP